MSETEPEVVSQPKLKTVRAIRKGFYDGHRRRVGAVFVVRADAKENWFQEVGEAPEGASLPPQITNGQAPARKTFQEVMKEQAGANPDAPVDVVEQTLAEAQASGAALSPTVTVVDDSDLT